MFLELIAIIIAGAAVYLLLYAVCRVARVNVPRWMMPAAAGVAMLLATINLEYSWFERTYANLRAGSEIIRSYGETSPLRPWTYIKPLTTRFEVVDGGNALEFEPRAGVSLVRLVKYERWHQPFIMAMAVDCGRAAIAPVPDVGQLMANGSVDDLPWGEVGAEDPLIQVMCRP